MVALRRAPADGRPAGAAPSGDKAALTAPTTAATTTSANAGATTTTTTTTTSSVSEPGTRPDTAKRTDDPGTGSTGTAPSAQSAP